MMMKAAGPKDHIETAEEANTMTVVSTESTIAVTLTPLEITTGIGISKHQF